MSPVDLGELTQTLLGEEGPDLLVGLQESDDAAVYRISETEAIVFTTDLITPVVDDAFHFGQVAAALSVTRAGAQPSIPTLHDVQGFVSP